MKNLIKITLSLTLLATLTQAKTYEDAEDGNTQGWRVYDNTPSGATISNIEDNGNRVIKLSGDITRNAYIIGGTSKVADKPNKWDAREGKRLSFKIKFDEGQRPEILVAIRPAHQSDKILYIRYRSATRYDENGWNRSGSILSIKLDETLENGEWHTITRDIEKDLQAYRHPFDPTQNSLIAINGMIIYGSALVDDIELEEDNTYIGNINSYLNDFSCSEGDLLKIQGGTIDAFSDLPDNPSHNPNTFLQDYAIDHSIATPVDYDNQLIDRHFIDTLSISSEYFIHSATFNIGFKPLKTTGLFSNDALYLGWWEESNSSSIGGHLYENVGSISWNPTDINGEGYLISRDLSTIDLNNTSTLLDGLRHNKRLDIYVQDDTSVDFTQLNLCVSELCGENIDLNLSQLDNWTNRPSTAIENNVFEDTQYQGVWDDTLNWFQFNSSDNDKILEIPFCSCGDINIDINSLKADNNASIELDSTTVVIQNAYDQQAMKRDDLGGYHVSGELSIDGNGVPTNHLLKLHVHNNGSYFGVAVDGELSFRGYLGKCVD